MQSAQPLLLIAAFSCSVPDLQDPDRPPSGQHIPPIASIMTCEKISSGEDANRHPGAESILPDQATVSAHHSSGHGVDIWVKEQGKGTASTAWGHGVLTGKFIPYRF